MVSQELSSLISLGAQIATIFGIFAALVGTFFAWRKFRVDKLAQQESFAKRLFSEYLDRCFSFPELSRPQSYPAMPPEDKVKYEWFVTQMLLACEEILEFSPNDEWRLTIAFHIEIHRDYFSSDRFKRERNAYSKELTDLLSSVARKVI